MRFKEFLLSEGDVIYGFEQKLRNKQGRKKQTDIEIPVSIKDKQPFDKFEVRVHPKGNSATIFGIRKDGYEESVGTTTKAAAEALADAYNHGGYSKHKIKKVPLSDVFK